jgi:uncharacterized protein
MTNDVLRLGRSDVFYESCRACDGRWLDAGELGAMVALSSTGVECFSHEPRPDITESPRQCPRCRDVALSKVLFLDWAPITLDHCDSCHGFWLDGGELDAVKDVLRAIVPRNVGEAGWLSESYVSLPDWYVAFIIALARHSRW